MADVFISHQHEDRARAAAIDKVLRDAGFSTWWDTALTAGDSWDETIRKELDAARCVLVLWSRKSWASRWVQAEATSGHERNILVCGRLDDVAIGVPFNLVQAANLTGWRGARDHPGVSEIIRGVETKLGRNPLGAAATATGERRRTPIRAPVGKSAKGGVSRAVARQGLSKSAALFVVAPIAVMIVVIVGWASLFPMLAGRAPAAAHATNAIMKPGTEFDDCNRASWCPKMIVIPAGTYMMGRPAAEAPDSPNHRREEPQHRVSVGKFAAGKYDVTFDEYDACSNEWACHRADDQGWGRGNRPVINISWGDAQTYVRWLSAKTHKAYRLLSEAEWEYAARAGTSTAYPWGDAIGVGRANCKGCGSHWDNQRTAPVGSFAPNAFGLFDMNGNVYEWVEDCSHDNYGAAPSDGSAWIGPSCEYRVLRGGSWFDIPTFVRSAYRTEGRPSERFDIDGFRVARSVY